MSRMRVEFGVGADLTEITKAIAILDKFGDKLTKVAAKTTESAVTDAKAWQRQEAALTRAISATLKQTDAMAKLGGMDDEIQRLTKRLAEFAAEIVKTSTTQVTLTRNQKAWNNTITESKRRMARYKAGLADAHKGMDKTKVAAKKAKDKLHELTNKMRNLESAAVLAVGPLSGIGARIRSLGAIMGRASWQTAAYVGVLVGLLVVLGKLAQASLKANKSYEKTIARLFAATGSMKKAREEFEFIVKTAVRLGIRIDTLAESYSKFAAAAKRTSLEGKGVRDMFVATTEAAASLRLNPQEVHGIFKALEQMVSKGTVQAEEMRGQFGERLPGAFKLVADSMKMTTKEMGRLMKAGELTAEVMFPKVQKALHDTYGKLAEFNAESYAGTIANVGNAWFLFALEFDKFSHASEFAIVGMQLVIKALNWMRVELKGMIKFLITATILLGVKKWLLAGKAMFYLATAIRAVAVATGLMNAAMLANPVGAVAIGITKLITLLVIAGAAWFGMNKYMETSAKNLEAYNLQLEENARLELAKELAKPGQKLVEDIAEMVIQAKYLNQALADVARGATTADAFATYEAALIAATVATDDYAKVAQDLSDALGGEHVTATLLGIAEALGILTGRIKATTDLFKEWDRTEKTIKKVEDRIKAVNEETRALQLGDAQQKIYKGVTKAVSAARVVLEATMLLEQDRKAILQELEAALMRQLAIKTQIKETTKLTKQIARDELAMSKRQEQNNVKMQKAYERAYNVIDLMADRLAAMATGPEGMRIFNQITRPLQQFENQLKRVVDQQGKQLLTQAEINVLVKQYNVLLQQQAILTGPAVQAAHDLGDAFGDAFERAITGAEGFTEALKSMVEEMYRIIARALIIDPIVNQVKTKLQGVAANLTSGTQGAFPSILNIFKRTPSAVTQQGGGVTTTGIGPAATATTTPYMGGASPKQVQVQFTTTVEHFERVITMFEEAIEKCAENCACMQSVCRAMKSAGPNLNFAAEGLSDAGSELMTASRDLGQVAKTMLIAQGVDKAGERSRLIGKGVDAYAAYASAGNAFGGPTRPGGMSLVAERGPEMLMEGNKAYLLTKQRGNVIPLSAFGGGSPIYNTTIIVPEERRRRSVSQEAYEVVKMQRKAHARNT